MSKEFNRRSFIAGAILVGSTAESIHVSREVNNIKEEADRIEKSAPQSPSVPDNFSDVIKEDRYEKRHVLERTILSAGGMVFSAGVLASEKWLRNRKDTLRRENPQSRTLTISNAPKS